MSGYFSGYIGKKQKVGQFELKQSVAALPLLRAKLDQRKNLSASNQLAHVVNRLFTALESKGILRTATEEFMLASEYKPHDPLSAEFIRTFREEFFYGCHFLNRYNDFEQKKAVSEVRQALPKHGHAMAETDQVSLYAFRSNDPTVFFLSPWEFVQYWKPHRLRPPSFKYELTT